MTIKALGFDLDDTLYSHAQYYSKIFRVMEQSILKTDIDFNDFYKVFQYYSIDEYNKFMKEIKTKREYKNDRVIKAYAQFGFSLSIADAIVFNSLYLYFQDQIELRSGVVNLINYAKNKGLEVFVLTNGPSADQRRKLAYLKIESLIKKDNWFISDELGFSKPDTRIFKHVQNALKFKSHEIIYVGDHFENDAMGAKNSGWEGIWLSDINTEVREYNTIKTISQVEEYI